MAKKRSSDAAAQPSRPSKKRKSAEASKAKMKEIAEVEEVDEVTEFDDTVALKAQITVDVDGVAEGAKEEGTGEVEEMPRTVVVPAFRKWETTSRMTAGGLISEMPSFDEATQEYSLVVDVRSKDSFMLKPLIITQGPHSGSCVFMLERTGTGFRFLDLPAEIRNHIYSFLVHEDDPIKIASYKPTNEPRRPVRDSFWHEHPGLTRHKRTGKWLEQPLSSFTILGVSKQVFREVAPIMYGDNHFLFSDLGQIKFFMDRIDSMRKYVRHIHVGPRGWMRSKARSAFTSMKGATDLQSLSFDLSMVRLNDSNIWSNYSSVNPVGMACWLRSMLRALQHAPRSRSADFDILDLVKIDWAKCTKCKHQEQGFATDEECQGCNQNYRVLTTGTLVKCKDGAERTKETEKALRKAIAKELGIKDKRSEEEAAKALKDDIKAMEAGLKAE